MMTLTAAAQQVADLEGTVAALNATEPEDDAEAESEATNDSLTPQDVVTVDPQTILSNPLYPSPRKPHYRRGQRPQ